MIKFSLKLDRDKLAYNPQPDKDWTMLFSSFIVLLVFLGIIHGAIFFWLESIKKSAGLVDDQTIIDENLLNQAMEIIEARKNKFLNSD